MFEVGTFKSLKDELEDVPIGDILLTAFECKTCGNVFPSKLDLRQHTEDTHI